MSHVQDKGYHRVSYELFHMIELAHVVLTCNMVACTQQHFAAVRYVGDNRALLMTKQCILQGMSEAGNVHSNARIRSVGHPCPASSLFTFTASPPHCCMLTFLCPFKYPAHPRLNPVTHSQPNPAQITGWQRLQRTTARPAALQPPVRTPTLQPPQHQHWLRRPPHSRLPQAPPRRAPLVRSCPLPHPRHCVQAPAASLAPPIRI